MESGVYIKDNLILGAFAGGFLLLGVGIGITIYRFNLARFLSLIRVDSLKEIIEETGRLYEAKWAREKERHKRLHWHATGKHLEGVPLRTNAADEVREQMTEVRPPLESRKL